MADKIRHYTNGHKYVGNLSTDARRLGIEVGELNKIVNTKSGITSIAREIFKAMVPESERKVDSWYKLSQDVLVKEKLLLGILKNIFRMQYLLSFYLFRFS